MAKADTSVKWFHSGMADAPVLSGQTGKLIELLDACLINGFSTRTPDSIVVADGVATVSISAGNPYEKHAVVVISGASDAALNAEWRIATSGASSFTFLCPGVADGTVSGATVKRAGAGWGKPFADTNIAVYQSLDPNSTQLYLRVNDADARYARVRGYEQMTDANTGTGLFPTLTQAAETVWTWPKSATADTVARSWVLVEDQSFFYWLPIWANNTFAPTTYSSVASVLFFGDIDKCNPSDKYNCIITAHQTSSPATVMSYYAGAGRAFSAGNYGVFIARAVSQSGGASPAVLRFPTSGNHLSGTLGNSPAHPTSDGRRVFGPPAVVTDGSSTSGNTGLRGFQPGGVTSQLSEWLPESPFSILDAYPTLTAIIVRAGLADRTSPMDPIDLQVGCAVVDIRGPWR